MSELTAIDILVNPDDATLARAREVNARLRQSVPTGIKLDATHQPHVTTLQRYVRTADLDQVYAAVEKTIAATEMTALSYQAVAISHTDWGVPGQALAGFIIKPSPAVLDFQAKLLAALTPFVESGGTAAAFATNPGETDISQSTLDWVEHYVPNQLGAGKYLAHITLGFATLDDLKTIEAEPFTEFAVRPKSVSVFHLGNNGTAHTELKSWDL